MPTSGHAYPHPPAVGACHFAAESAPEQFMPGDIPIVCSRSTRPRHLLRDDKQSRKATTPCFSGRHPSDSVSDHIRSKAGRCRLGRHPGTAAGLSYNPPHEGLVISIAFGGRRRGRLGQGRFGFGRWPCPCAGTPPRSLRRGWTPTLGEEPQAVLSGPSQGHDAHRVFRASELDGHVDDPIRFAERLPHQDDT